MATLFEYCTYEDNPGILVLRFQVSENLILTSTKIVIIPKIIK